MGCLTCGVEPVDRDEDCCDEFTPDEGADSNVWLAGVGGHGTAMIAAGLSIAACAANYGSGAADCWYGTVGADDGAVTVGGVTVEICGGGT